MRCAHAASLVLQGSNFKQLVGLHKNSTPGLPQEKGGWRLLNEGGTVWWIARDAWCGLHSVQRTPLCGKSGESWVADFKELHGDAACRFGGVGVSS